MTIFHIRFCYRLTCAKQKGMGWMESSPPIGIKRGNYDDDGGADDVDDTFKLIFFDQTTSVTVVKLISL